MTQSRPSRRTSPARPRREQSAAVPQHVIDAACRVFAQKGFQASTMADVAEEMQASRATLYYYVSSKDQLLDLVIRDFVAIQADRLYALRLEGLEPAAQVRRVFQIALAPFATDPDLAGVFVRESGRLPPQSRREQRKLEKAIQTEVERVITEGIEAGAFRRDLDAHLAALALFGMVNWLHVWYRRDHGVPVERIAEVFSDLFLGGVMRPQAPNPGTSADATLALIREMLDVLQGQLTSRHSRRG